MQAKLLKTDMGCTLSGKGHESIKGGVPMKSPVATQKKCKGNRDKCPGGNAGVHFCRAEAGAQADALNPPGGRGHE